MAGGKGEQGDVEAENKQEQGVRSGPGKDVYVAKVGEYRARIVGIQAPR